MASQLTPTTAALPSDELPGADLLHGLSPAEPTYDAASSEADGSLESEEVLAFAVKQEERAAQNALNPFAVANHFGPNELGGQKLSQNPFEPDPVAISPAASSKQAEPQGRLGTIPRPLTAIQRRNHARVSDIVTRLQNFNGSVTELLAIASVQQQLDVAFADLECAKNQLKDVFRQFELQGHISNRQCQKKNGAARDFTRASQRIVQLSKELWDLQRRGC
ncbi:hypothetical protein F4802DRAFT_209562 [Xylaria palmicola]|nr:hypothetical protein F4802DRAFT_209562 [Xylaria palmicola]